MALLFLVECKCHDTDFEYLAWFLDLSAISIPTTYVCIRIPIGIIGTYQSRLFFIMLVNC